MTCAAVYASSSVADSTASSQAPGPYGIYGQPMPGPQVHQQPRLQHEALDEYLHSQFQNRPLDVQRSASTPVGHTAAGAGWSHHAAYVGYPPVPALGTAGPGVGAAVPILRGQSQPLPGQVQVQVQGDHPHPQPTDPTHGGQGGWYAHPPPMNMNMNMNYSVPMPFYPHHQPPAMHAPVPPSNAPSTSNAASNVPAPVSPGVFVGHGGGGGVGNGGHGTPQRRYAQARGDHSNNASPYASHGQGQGQGQGHAHAQGQGQGSQQQPHYVLHNYTNLDLQHSRGRNGTAGTVKQQHGHGQAPSFEHRSSGTSAAGSARGSVSGSVGGGGGGSGRASTGRSTPSAG